jgi:hypothetical protein
VQEALTNMGKHATGTATQVGVSGAPAVGLHVSVRNRQPAGSCPGRTGAAGARGGRARASGTSRLAGGTLVHGRTELATSLWTPSSSGEDQGAAGRR